MGPTDFHSDETVRLGSSLHDGLSLHDHLAEDDRTGFGSLVQVHSAFEGTFHTTGRAHRFVSVTRNRVGKVIRPVARATGEIRGGASVDEKQSVDPEQEASSHASLLTQHGAHGASIGSVKAARLGNRGYEATRRGVFKLQKHLAFKTGKQLPTKSVLPQSIPQVVESVRDRRRVAHSMRKAARRDRRLARRMRPASSKTVRQFRKAKRSTRGTIRLFQAGFNRGVWAVASAPMVGIVIVLIAVIASLSAVGASASITCGGSPTIRTGSLSDDYYYGPHGKSPRGANSGTSPMGYEYGNCTDFVAWRINRANGSTRPPFKYGHAQLTPKGGNGSQWGDPGNLPGWTVVRAAAMVSPGDVVSYKPGIDGADPVYGHVAYVAAVSASSVTTENYANGHYYQEKIPADKLQNWIKNAGVVVKHDPHGVAISTSSEAGCDVGGMSSADAGPSTRDVADAKAYALQFLGGDEEKFAAVDHIYTHESGWRWNAVGPYAGRDHAYGIPQALPGSKMASEGADWKTNAKTQVRWGIKYMWSRYGSEEKAWAFWQVHHYY